MHAAEHGRLADVLTRPASSALQPCSPWRRLLLPLQAAMTRPLPPAAGLRPPPFALTVEPALQSIHPIARTFYLRSIWRWQQPAASSSAPPLLGQPSPRAPSAACIPPAHSHRPFAVRQHDRYPARGRDCAGGGGGGAPSAE